MANSAAYCRGQPVTTISRAVLLMGEMMVVGVAICVSTSIIFQRPLDGYESPEGELWEHSLRSAIACRELAKFTKGKVNPGLAFTAGLLHDIGKSIISEFLVGSTKEMTDLCTAPRVQPWSGVASRLSRSPLASVSTVPPATLRRFSRPFMYHINVPMPNSSMVSARLKTQGKTSLQSPVRWRAPGGGHECCRGLRELRRSRTWS